MNKNENIEAHTREELEYFVTNYKIFIDTCSIMSSSADIFWANITPLLLQCNKKILIPYHVIKDLKNIKDDTNGQKKKEDRQSAEKGYNKCTELYKNGLIDLRRENLNPGDNSDVIYKRVFEKFKSEYNLLLITQNKSIASDILDLNDSKTNSGKKIQVKKISSDGFLSDTITINNHSKITLPQNETFKICHQISTVDDTPLIVSHVPKENDYVYIYENKNFRMRNAKRVLLGEKLSEGGEGCIYALNSRNYNGKNFVAKIYIQKKLTKRKYEKLQLMLSKSIDCEGICYPLMALYGDPNGNEFVGYLMRRSKGDPLRKYVFKPMLLQTKFPSWTKKDTVKLCITILEKIKYLHDRNIILGDINPANILVTSPTEVYFVDADSYQVEGFPCPVGMAEYTAPEIQGKHYGEFLRTIGNENYAVATLLFEIMLPGKNPYSQQGGEDLVSNICKMEFPYRFGDKYNQNAPDGKWRFMWSHLPKWEIKEAFYCTFQKGEKYSTEETRLSVEDWLIRFKKYLTLLNNGTIREQDRMSEELFPKRPKKNNDWTYITCKLCGNEMPERQCLNGICKPCLDDVKEYHQCIDCGDTFEVTNGEYEYFMEKGLELPKRCKDCRKNRQ